MADPQDSTATNLPPVTPTDIDKVTAPEIPDALKTLPESVRKAAQDTLKAIAGNNNAINLEKFTAPSEDVQPTKTAKKPVVSEEKTEVAKKSTGGRWDYVKDGMLARDLRPADQAYLQAALMASNASFKREHMAKFGGKPDGVIGTTTNRYLAEEAVTDRSGKIDLENLKSFDAEYKSKHPEKAAQVNKLYPAKPGGSSSETATTASKSTTQTPETVNAPQGTGHKLTAYPKKYVEHLQGLLVGSGYLDDGAVDGKVGPKTLEAAKKAGLVDENGLITAETAKQFPAKAEVKANTAIEELSPDVIKTMQKTLVAKGLLPSTSATGEVTPETLAAAKKAGIVNKDNTLNPTGVVVLEEKLGETRVAIPIPKKKTQITLAQDSDTPTVAPSNTPVDILVPRPKTEVVR